MADDWVTKMNKQEEDVAKRMLSEKLDQMALRDNGPRSNSATSAGEGWPTLPDDKVTNKNQQEIKSEGWPILPQQSPAGVGARGNASSDLEGVSRPSVGGAGRGNVFKLRDDADAGAVGGFAALGRGGQSQSFGQFGGFSSASSQISANTSTPQRTSAPFFNGTGFNFKTATGGSGFKLNSANDTKFSVVGNLTSGGDTSTNGTNNWPSLDNEKTQSTASGWSTFGAGLEGEASATAPKPSSVSNVVDGAQEESGEDEKPMDNAEASYLNKILHDKLVNTKYDVEIERQNPNNPLFSVKSFEELRLTEELLKGIYEMGFRYPSKIQESALPALLADPPQTMIAQSQSGTGKTAAFVLTMLSRVDPTEQCPQCLCLSPTYELALQIGKVVEQMGKYLKDVKVAYAVRGGTRIERGEKVYEQIIIGTPGTLLDWVLRFRFFDPKKIAVFVLDEADLMIGLQGHQDQSIRIRKLLPESCQHLLFSATYDDEVMDFAYKIISDPVVIRLRREEETLDCIKQFSVSCQSRDEKYSALCTLYGTLTIGQAIIFCKSKREASWLAGKMSSDGHAVSLLSGELSIEQRAAIFDRFKRGDEKVLISTNLTARGIDVQQVNIVINYDLPTTKDGEPDFEAYLHRIGRSGRFGKAGIAINFIDSNWSRHMMDRIEAHFGKRVEPLNVSDPDALENIESWD